MPHTLSAWIAAAICYPICLFAIWRGGRWEKTSGLVLLVVEFIGPIIQDDVHWMDPEGRLFALDLALLVFFLGMAIGIGRRWMIFAAAFQLLSTLSHPAAHFARQIGPYAYLTVFVLFSYGVFFSVGAGALASPRRGRLQPPTESRA